MYRALTIAGSDSGGGAGIQADLKTFTAFGVFGTSAITALTAQNTIGVQGIMEVDPTFVERQIRSVLDDIGTDAVKTGMLSSPGIVKVVSGTMCEYHIKNIVVDPVMVAKSGNKLLSIEACRVLIEELLPIASVVTPNIHEAQVMLNMEIKTRDDMREAGRLLKERGCGWVVIKGGHLGEGSEVTDIVYNGDEFFSLSGPRVDTKNTHGTGCTFSSAIAAGLAKGYDTLEAIKKAKSYISMAIKESFTIGSGHGPTNHLVGTRTTW
jgi:hydroxymethylpyrimidine/phosphomethylpyrimidine kinase